MAPLCLPFDMESFDQFESFCIPWLALWAVNIFFASFLIIITIFFNTPNTYTRSNENKNHIAIIFKNNENPLESDPIKPKWLMVGRGESRPVPTEARKTGRTFNLISHPKTD